MWIMLSHHVANCSIMVISAQCSRTFSQHLCLSFLITPWFTASLTVTLFFYTQYSHFYRPILLLINLFSAYCCFSHSLFSLVGWNEDRKVVCSGKDFQVPVFSRSRIVTFTPSSPPGSKKVLLENNIVSDTSVCVLWIGRLCSLSVQIAE